MKPVYSLNDRFLLAATVWGEARSQGPEGMRAVAHVIMNRVAHKSKAFGIGIGGVTQHQFQFSCWNGNDPNCANLTERHLEGMSRATPDGAAWLEAKQVAVNLLDKNDPDPTHGATMYHTVDSHPYWDQAKYGYKLVATIGAHLFYA